MGVRDLGLERGRSPLWILNHPRFHGSAWKVPALDIEPSTISRFSVESHRSEYRTIHDFTVQRGRSLLWISNHPRFHGSAWKVTLWISNHPRFHGSAWKVMLWISNHPRYRGSAWKVPALDNEPSTISWFSVESPRSGSRHKAGGASQRRNSRSLL